MEALRFASDEFIALLAFGALSRRCEEASGNEGWICFVIFPGAIPTFYDFLFFRRVERMFTTSVKKFAGVY